MVKSKRVGNKWKKNLFSTIRFKLAGSYCLLIGFIIIAGVAAYTSAFGTIKVNYKTSTLQSLDMLGEYPEFGFDTVSGAAVEYLSDTNVTDYLTGGMAAKKADQSTYYTDKKSEITTKVTADTFLQSIYLFSDGVPSLSTNKKSALNMFSDYTQSEQGKVLLEDAQAYYWFGKPSIIDETLNVDSNNYAIRMVKAFYRKEAFLVMDIDRRAVTDILNKIQMGEDCRIAFVTGDGVEISGNGSREPFFDGADFYERSKAEEESLGTMENVSLEGRDYMFLYRKVADTGAMVCMLIPESEITGQVEDMRGSFNGMKGQVEALLEKVEAIVSSIERMHMEKEESVNKMEHISEVTAEAFESITAANGKTKNQVQIVEELSMLSEKMLYQVEQLEAALGEFHV